jgi:hypothetical protein
MFLFSHPPLFLEIGQLASGLITVTTVCIKHTAIISSGRFLLLFSVSSEGE